MSPSLSSSFFLRPQILHATTNNPARTIAPPTPTTTPMTVFLVLVDMPEDLFDSLPLSDAAFVGLAITDSNEDVDDERMVELPTTEVTTITVVPFEVDGFSVVFVASLVLVGLLVVVSLFEEVGEGLVEVGVLEVGVEDDFSDVVVGVEVVVASVDTGVGVLESGVDEADEEAVS